MARAVAEHKTKPANRTSRRKTRPGAFDVLLKDVFPLEPNKALQCLTALARQWPSMPVLKWGVHSKRWGILPLEAISVSVGIDPATGIDTLGIRDTRYFHPALDEPAEFYARSTDIADIESAELLRGGDKVMVESDYDPIAKFEQEIAGQPRTPPRLYPASPAPDKEPVPTKASKLDSGAKPAREPSFEQAARDAAIQHRLNNGVVPGSTVQWNRFCHRVRADCGVYTEDPKKIPRGLTDDRITRITRMLMKRQA
jgi:hypothetical protein